MFLLFIIIIGCSHTNSVENVLTASSDEGVITSYSEKEFSEPISEFLDITDETNEITQIEFGDETISNPDPWETTFIEIETEDSINNSYETPEYLFYSIQDMHTYIATGSKELSDYESPPMIPFEHIIPSEVIQKLGYFPFDEYFDYDESLFNSSEASFIIKETGYVLFRYYIDNVYITVRPVRETEAADLITCYTKYFGIQNAITEKDVIVYSPDSQLKDGYMLREYEGFEILYRIKNGVKQVASFVIDGYFVTINGVCYSTADSLPADFTAFMKNNAYNAFSTFFSEDNTDLEKAIHDLKKSSQKS